MKVNHVEADSVSIELRTDEVEVLEDLLARRVEESRAPFPHHRAMRDNFRALRVLIKAHSEGFPG